MHAAHVNIDDVIISYHMFQLSAGASYLGVDGLVVIGRRVQLECPWSMEVPR